MSRSVPKKLDALTHELGDDGDIVLFDQQGNQLLLLNDIGAAVWLVIDGTRCVDDIVDLILQTLPAPRAQVEQDVLEFLKTLSDHHLIGLEP